MGSLISFESVSKKKETANYKATAIDCIKVQRDLETLFLGRTKFMDKDKFLLMLMTITKNTRALVNKSTIAHFNGL